MATCNLALIYNWFHKRAVTVACLRHRLVQQFILKYSTNSCNRIERGHIFMLYHERRCSSLDDLPNQGMDNLHGPQ